MEELMRRFREENIYFRVTAQEYDTFCDFCRETDTFFAVLTTRRIGFDTFATDSINNAGVCYLTYGYTRGLGVQYSVPDMDDDGHSHLDESGWTEVVFADELATLDRAHHVSEADLLAILSGG